MTEQHEFNPNEWQDSGAKWAEGFRKTILDQGIPVDEDLMLGWFCNAIEIAHTHRLQTDTHLSASREIAVKKLEWKPIETTLCVGFEAKSEFGTYNVFWSDDAARWLIDCPLKNSHGGWGSKDEAKAAAQADYERRILSAIDTTPGNTDPIAKYDDELRKVQGGWRDMDDPELERITGNRGLVDIWVPNLGRITDVLHPSVYVGPTHWRLPPPAPTEHPTEQPSVRDAAYAKLEEAACALIDFHNGPNYCKRPDIFQRHMQSIAAALRSLAQ